MSKEKKGSSCQPINGWHKCWDIPTPIAHTLLTYFYLRSVLLLRNPWCVYSLSLSAYDRSRMVHAVSWCMGMTASVQGTLLLRWEFIELQFKPFFWPCLWLWTDLSSSHAWADPGMSHIIQVPEKQWLLRVWGQLWYMRHHTIKIQYWTSPSAPAVTHLVSVVTLHWVMKLLRFNL